VVGPQDLILFSIDEIKSDFLENFEVIELEEK
jgi:hypothetical protein